MSARPDIAAALRERLNDPRGAGATDPALLGREILRHLEPDAPGRVLRPSGLGYCARSIAYALAGYAPEERDGSAMTVMGAIGDAIELLLVASLDGLFADPPETLAGWRLDGARSAGGQVRSHGAIEVGGMLVDLSGSTDGMLVAPDGTASVLEVKGVSATADRQIGMDLAHGIDPWGRGHRHYWQNEAYMLGLGVDASAVVTVCRDSGRVQSWWRSRDRGYEGAISEHLGRVLESFDPDDVRRVLPDGKRIEPVVDLHKRTGKPNKGNGALPTACAMCDYARRCWGSELSTTWDGGKRVLRLGRETDSVPEIA